ncbi:MAG: hypothetical protein IKS31_12585 [Clostridia bacterium]|nr:hypothetical protein [Clostridia bacterium]
MKKLTAVLLALCALLTVMPGWAENVTLSEEMLAIVGAWDIYLGETLMAEMEFFPDGTYESTAYGVVIGTGTWSAADGVFYDGAQGAPYTLEDGVLTIKDEQQELVLRRKDVPAATGEAAEIDEAILGRWQLSDESMEAVLAQANIKNTEEIAAAAALMTIVYDFRADGTLAVQTGIMEQEYSFSAADGILSMTDSEEMQYTVDGDTLTVIDSGMTLTFFRVEAE